MTQGNMANRIRTQRKSIGITQQTLADKIGVSMMTIVRWENGVRTPNSYIMPKLAEALNTSVQYLMGLQDTPSEHGDSAQTLNAPDVPVSATLTGKNIVIRDTNTHQEIEIPNDAEGHKLFLQLFSGLFSGFGAHAVSNAINGNNNNGNNLGVALNSNVQASITQSS